MTTELEVGLYIFILAGFLGYHVITRVPPLLHTPLMSATNAMSGISLGGSLVVAGSGHGALSTAFGFIAVACSTTNVVGGFLITDRMLSMFKTREAAAKAASSSKRGLMAGLGLLLVLGIVWAAARGRAGFATVDLTPVMRYAYILSAMLFILGLKGLSSPKYARRGMFPAE